MDLPFEEEPKARVLPESLLDDLPLDIWGTLQPSIANDLTGLSSGSFEQLTVIAVTPSLSRTAFPTRLKKIRSNAGSARAMVLQVQAREIPSASCP